jgi:hypothetical protein
VERFCDDAVWLDGGRKRADGDPKRVIGAYVTDVERQEETFLASTDAKAAEALHGGGAQAIEPADAGEAVDNMFQAQEGRWGSGGAAITNVTFQNEAGETTHVFHSGEALSLRLKVRAERELTDFVFGIGIFNAEGVCIYGTNTDIEEHEAASLEGEADVTLAIEALDLVEGTYKLDVALHKRDGAPYDYHRLLYTFRVKSRIKDIGIYRPRHHWHFSENVRFKLKT